MIIHQALKTIVLCLILLLFLFTWQHTTAFFLYFSFLDDFIIILNMTIVYNLFIDHRMHTLLPISALFYTFMKRNKHLSLFCCLENALSIQIETLIDMDVSI